MTALREKKDWSGRKSWPCLVNSVEFSQKKVLSPTNGNLYAYAANNPVHYIDPDGRVDDYTEDQKFVLFDLIKTATNQEPLDIIRKFNEAHPDKTIDENTLCELFADPDKSKALLMQREELHKDLRYLLNEKAPKNLNAAQGRMKKMPWLLSLFHKPLENIKMISGNGHMEGVYNRKTGLQDPREESMATFNFFSPSYSKTAHKKTDMDPFYKWGN